MVLGNKHYWQHGWELVSLRTEEDHLRNEKSTFASIAKQGGARWEFKKVDPRKNKYVISIVGDEVHGQDGWRLNA